MDKKKQKDIEAAATAAAQARLAAGEIIRAEERAWRDGSVGELIEGLNSFAKEALGHLGIPLSEPEKTPVFTKQEKATLVHLCERRTCRAEHRANRKAQMQDEESATYWKEREIFWDRLFDKVETLKVEE